MTLSTASTLSLISPIIGAATATDDGLWHVVFNFDNYAELLPIVRNSLLAAIVLGIAGGLFGTFVMMRDLPFAVHGISELSFAGAAAALLLGGSVIAGSILGSLVAAAVLGVLGVRARDRNSIIGVLMPFGLGLGVLFISLYQGRAANKFGLLTGQIAAVSDAQLVQLTLAAVVAIVTLLVIWRPLTFASVDPEVAQARGVPVTWLAPVFMVALGVAVAISIQVVGALLVLALLCTPAAAATKVTASPFWVPALSTLFALVATVGGILLALGARVPPSPYITTLSFVIYLVCRVIGASRSRRGWSYRPA